MYAVEDEMFRKATSLLSAIAEEFAGQEASGSRRPVDLRKLIRRSASVELPEAGEAAYVSTIAADLARLFPIEELFPRKRRAT